MTVIQSATKDIAAESHCRFSQAWDPAFAEPFPPDPHVTMLRAAAGSGSA